jgi:hypothetical protein
LVTITENSIDNRNPKKEKDDSLFPRTVSMRGTSRVEWDEEDPTFVRFINEKDEIYSLLLVEKGVGATFFQTGEKATQIREKLS